MPTHDDCSAVYATVRFDSLADWSTMPLKRKLPNGAIFEKSGISVLQGASEALTPQIIR